MIPGSFAYHRPTSVKEALALLADFGEEGRPLAGGHSLIPMMKLRLASPANLVDLGGISDLKGIREDGADIVIGATTTQHELIASDLLGKKLPILRETSLQIADPQVRYVGTLGGNIANGDPGNDMPAVMLCLGATYQVAGKSGQRRIAAREFYEGAYFTALAPGEIVTAIRIPAPPAGHGFAYHKLKRKIGDYATAAAAVVLTLEGGGDVGQLLDRPHQCRRNTALGRRSRKDHRRLEARCRDREKGCRGGREDHVACFGPARHAPIPNQDGGRDARPRAGARRATRPGRVTWPNPRFR